MTKISAPGIYAMDAETYHGEPCDAPSLGSTGARTLASECPAAFRFAVHQEKAAFDIGSATHLLVLEPEQFKARVQVVIGHTKKGDPSYDYTTADAKEQREAAREAGKIPLLMDEYDDVQAMREAVFSDPIAKLAFSGGAAEQSMFWRDPEFGFWCKTRPDYLPAHRRYLVDLKTSTTANPEAFAKAAVNFGYHQQAAWYLDGVEAVTGERPERFAFIVVSKKPPYLVSTCWLDEEAIEWGRILNRYARGVFAWCLDRNEWPAYRPVLTGQPAAFTISLPAFALRDLQARHEAGAFIPPQELERAA